MLGLGLLVCRSYVDVRVGPGVQLTPKAGGIARSWPADDI